MTEANALSLAFLKSQPRAAAGMIQQIPPEQVIDFLRDAPLSSLTSLIHEMASWPGARVLSLLPASQIARVMKELPSGEAETLLRLLDEELRVAVIAQMPAALGRSFKRKLTFPAATVGAWMDTTIPAFTPDNSVQDCLDLVKKKQSHLGGVVVVVDYSHKPLGVVAAEKLLISDNNQLLADLLDGDIECLPARATLNEIEYSPGWVRFSALPVIDRNSVLLGVLTHSDLLAGMSRAVTPYARDNMGFSLLSNMGRAFFVSLTGLVSLLGGEAERAAANQRLEAGGDEL